MMSNTSLFLYGTLCHKPLLETVLGYVPDWEPATLGDHHVTWAKDQAFPLLSAQSGAVAEGYVLRNLSETDIARLDFYESLFEYQLVPVEVTVHRETRTSMVYVPVTHLLEPGDAWSLKAWEDTWSDLTCIAAREIMSYFGHLTSADVARRLPVIRARAQAQLFARHTTPHPLDPSTTEDVRVLDRRRPYSEFFSSEEVDLKHRRFDGEMSGEMTRAVFVGCDAVIVLPYDPIRDRVLLVEQFRAGPFVRGDQNPWSLEPIAGRIEGGQTPTAAAHREALEEANLTFTHLEAVSGAYPSPSCMSEYYHLFTGLCDLPDDITGLAGLEQEHEDIKSHVLQFDDLMYHVQAGCMTNAPLILLTYWLAYHRNRLRARMA